MKWKPGARDTEARERAFIEGSASFCLDDLDESCLKCTKPAKAVVSGKPYCMECGHELYFRQAYIPLTETEKRNMRILAKATMRQIKEGPDRRDGCISVFSLNRLAEIAQEIAADEPWVN